VTNALNAKKTAVNIDHFYTPSYSHTTKTYRRKQRKIEKGACMCVCIRVFQVVVEVSTVF
jgi:hypothetical protein